MKFLEKIQTVIMLGAIGLGLALGQLPKISEPAGKLIIPALMAMMFGLFLSIPLNDLKKSFTDFKFAITTLVINFIWIPILGWGLGGFFLADHPELRLGFLMLLVTPCTDWYLVFTGIARGNVPLSTAILPLNLIVQVVLLPAYLFIFVGISGAVDLKLLAKSVFLVLLLPFSTSQLIRVIFKDQTLPRTLLEKIFGEGQFWFLCLAIAAMFASQAGYLTQHLEIFILLLTPVLLFFIINFFVGRIVSKALKFSFPDSVSLSMTTLARNSPISLAIAVTVFPNEPLIALALIIGPLIELPVLGLTAQLLLWMGSKKTPQQT